MKINVKILGMKSRQRYTVRRLVTAAETVLRAEYPDLEVDVLEVKTEDEIYQYTHVLIAPGLVINDKLVYDQWIPSKEQVIDWLRAAIEEMQSQPI